ncbi:MAG: HlyC/CorC family transporter [Rhizobacter sp.]|nr:HlyC/CorC family transporter [Chlorobiales bacterium]
MFEVLAILTTLLFAAFFSGSEIAFVTANRLRLEVFERKKIFGSKLANYFIRHIDQTLTTTLVGNNLAHTVYVTLMVASLERLFGERSLVLHTLIASVIVLLAGEVIPKLILRELADYAVIIIAPVLRLTRFVLFPVIWISELISRAILWLFGTKDGNLEQFFRKQDFEILLRENVPIGAAQAKDAEIISNVFVLSDIRVRESMVPRTDIEGLEKTLPMKEVYKRFAESGYSKMAVYEESIDNIIGVAFVHDLFTKPKTLSGIVRKVMFVPETKKSAELLREFTQSGESVAIVVDEFGGTAGLVTAEDLIEELVGDIQDEFDSDEEVCKALSDDTYLISGRINIDTVNEKFALGIAKSDYETMGGFVLSRIGRIPQQGEIITIDDFIITVAKSSRTKIDVIKLQVSRPLPA